MANKKQNVLFVVLAYAIFWVIVIAGGSVMLSGNEELFDAILPYAQIIGTWAPTFALLILFKKLYPNWTIKEFYKNAFKERLNFKLLSVVTFAYLFITFCIVCVGALIKGVSFFSLLNYSFDGFLITLFSGAMGEESGWRGHLQPSIEKEHSVLWSCLIVGIIWAFWHVPTWIFYIDGMLYMIPLDILTKISIAFIIGICYSRCRNLFIPMWIHFVANMVVNGTQAVLIDFYVWYALLEVFVALGYIVWYKRTGKKEITEV